LGRFNFEGKKMEKCDARLYADNRGVLMTIRTTFENLPEEKFCREDIPE